MGKKLIETVTHILIGIDQTECESDIGWWETSYGAKFGAEILKQVIHAIEDNTSDDLNTDGDIK